MKPGIEIVLGNIANRDRVERMGLRQCKKCPWRVGTDPREIPNGYCEAAHRRLTSTMATGSAEQQLMNDTIRIMACHNSPVGEEQPCVGWLHHQLGRGNNLTLRLMVFQRRIGADYELDGEQHETLEDTFPD
jgi:hypothetical protein